jgi:hypothetical protein
MHECEVHGFELDFGSFGDEQISEIGMYDVLCGRHKAAFNNIGNRRFRITVSLALDRYLSAGTRREKSNVIKSITSLVHRNGGRFLQLEHGKWIELNAERAHKKVAHAMRDVSAKNLQPIKLRKTEADVTETMKKLQKQDISRAISDHFCCPSKRPDEFVNIYGDESSISFKPWIEDTVYDASCDLVQANRDLLSIENPTLSTLLLKNT